MPTLDNGKPVPFDPIAHLPDRDEARRAKAPRYRPATRCERHPHAAFYTCNDTCAACYNTTARGTV
jgi:hypothetical protein